MTGSEAGTRSWTSSWRITLCGICLLLQAGCGNPPPDTDDPRRYANPSSSPYQPTPPQPQDKGERLVGPHVVTVDARSEELWMYFDFSRGSVIPVRDPKSDAWDLAFRRHVIRSNGGATNPAGQAALLRLDTPEFSAITRVPDGAIFVSDVRTTKRLRAYNPVLEKWYNYSYTANVLVPKPVVYIVRTQDGKYAKMRLLSYYCKSEIAGCMTFEYIYQGDGSPNFATPQEG
ncbi:hypothetical protein NKDENANG_00235 [Candidatus Entotheonellaceae bacterium PAL068K]